MKRNNGKVTRFATCQNINHYSGLFTTGRQCVRRESVMFNCFRYYMILESKFNPWNLLHQNITDNSCNIIFMNSYFWQWNISKSILIYVTKVRCLKCLYLLLNYFNWVPSLRALFIFLLSWQYGWRFSKECVLCLKS